MNRVWWSDAEFELFGINPKDLRPSFDAFLSLLHPDDRKVAVERVEAMLAGADEFANDFRLVRGDGSCIWIHSRARATRDASGKIVRVEGTDQDITAQRLAREAAEESERRLQAAIEVAQLGIVTVKYEDQTVEFSPRAAEQFGFAPHTKTTRSELHSRFHPSESEAMAGSSKCTRPGWLGMFRLGASSDSSGRHCSVAQCSKASYFRKRLTFRSRHRDFGCDRKAEG